MQGNPLKISKELFYDLEKQIQGQLAENDLRVLTTQPEIIRGLNFILLEANRLNSSDIHFEAYHDRYEVRFRIDGLLHEMLPVPFRLGIGIVSRIKVLAD